jgi:hypothetical protein
MSKEQSDDSRRYLLEQIVKQEEKLRNEQRKSAVIATMVVSAVLLFLACLDYVGLGTSSLSPIAFVVEVGTFLIVLVLLAQGYSLSRETRTLLPAVKEWNSYQGTHPSVHVKTKAEVLVKLYDVNKNTIDKLFEKLQTFSNTWLAVSGGIASSLFVEIIKSETLNSLSAMVLIACSVLVWSLAQDIYGILNYGLVRTTKDLSFWWTRTFFDFER